MKKSRGFTYPSGALPIEALADGSTPGPAPRPAYAMAQWVLPSQDEQLGLPNGRSSARGSSRTQMESWQIPQSCHCHGDHRWIYMIYMEQNIKHIYGTINIWYY